MLTKYPNRYGRTSLIGRGIPETDTEYQNENRPSQG